MNWDALGAVAELLAALAVIASLLYVGKQVRSSTEEQREASVDATMQNMSTWRMGLAANADLATLFGRGLEAPESLDAADQLRFQCMLDELVWGLYTIGDKTERGTFDSDASDRAQFQLSDMFAAPGAAAWWQARQGVFPSRFRGVFEAVIATSSVAATVGAS